MGTASYQDIALRRFLRSHIQEVPASENQLAQIVEELNWAVVFEA